MTLTIRPQHNFKSSLVGRKNLLSEQKEPVERVYTKGFIRSTIFFVAGEKVVSCMSSYSGT